MMSQTNEEKEIPLKRAKTIICKHLEGYEGNINSNADYVASLLSENLSESELKQNIRGTLRGKDPQIFINWLLSFIASLESKGINATLAQEEEALIASSSSSSFSQTTTTNSNFNPSQMQPPRQRPERNERNERRGSRRSDDKLITITRNNYDAHDRRGNAYGSRSRNNNGSSSNFSRRDPHDELCPSDPHCDKEGCPYKHTVPPINNAKCRFDPNCTNTKCPFKHTVPPEVVIKLKQQEETIKRLTDKLIAMPVSPAAAAMGMQAIQSPPCKNGFACPGRLDKSCHFSHPAIKCAHRDDGTCRFGPNCRYSHAPDCRYGAGCTKPGCTYAHPGDVDSDAIMTSSMLNQQQPPSHQQFYGNQFSQNGFSGNSAPAAGAFVDPLAPVPGAAVVPVPLSSAPASAAVGDNNNNNNNAGDNNNNAGADASNAGGAEKNPGDIMCPMGENCMDMECPYKHPGSENTGVSTV